MVIAERLLWWAMGLPASAIQGRAYGYQSRKRMSCCSFLLMTKFPLTNLSDFRQQAHICALFGTCFLAEVI